MSEAMNDVLNEVPDAEVLEALRRALRTAMEQTIKARIPECAEFAGIAQDLDFVVAELEQLQQRTIRALLDEIEALQAECEKLRKENQRLKDGALEDLRLRTSALEMMNAANSEAEALRKDAERYRWLRGECKRPIGGLTIAMVTEWGLEAWSGDDPDNRIDAAMREEGRQ